MSGKKFNAGRMGLAYLWSGAALLMFGLLLYKSGGDSIQPETIIVGVIAILNTMMHFYYGNQSTNNRGGGGGPPSVRRLRSETPVPTRGLPRESDRAGRPARRLPGRRMPGVG